MMGEHSSGLSQKQAFSLDVLPCDALHHAVTQQESPHQITRCQYHVLGLPSHKNLKLNFFLSLFFFF
jgi:hypothetical protein